MEENHQSKVLLLILMTYKKQKKWMPFNLLCFFQDYFIHWNMSELVSITNFYPAFQTRAPPNKIDAWFCETDEDI